MACYTSKKVCAQQCMKITCRFFSVPSFKNSHFLSSSGSSLFHKQELLHFPREFPLPTLPTVFSAQGSHMPTASPSPALPSHTSQPSHHQGNEIHPAVESLLTVLIQHHLHSIFDLSPEPSVCTYLIFQCTRQFQMSLSTLH